MCLPGSLWGASVNPHSLTWKRGGSLLLTDHGQDWGPGTLTCSQGPWVAARSAGALSSGGPLGLDRPGQSWGRAGTSRLIRRPLWSWGWQGRGPEALAVWSLVASKVWELPLSGPCPRHSQARKELGQEASWTSLHPVPLGTMPQRREPSATQDR